MVIERWAIIALRIVLVGFFLVLIPFELLSLPGQFRHLAQENPQDAGLRWPATAITVFWMVCIQVVIVCTGQLLRMVTRDQIFSAAALRWVDAIIWTIAAGWLTLVAVFLWVGFHADDPGVPVLLFLMTTAVTVAGLLMIVMRALLRQATTLRTDMEAVI